MELSHQIKNLRELKHLSQDELADLVFVSRQTISSWETGKTLPDILSLLLLSDLFNVPIDGLVREREGVMPVAADTTKEHASVQNVCIEPIAECHAKSIAHMLSTDEALNRCLNKRPLKERDAVTPEDFMTTTLEWMKTRNAESFAIVVDGVAQGLISLSHQDLKKGFVCCGSWLASSLWGHGITTKAFADIRKIAAERGFKLIRGTIYKADEPSKRLWKRAGARFEQNLKHKERLLAFIEL